MSDRPALSRWALARQFSRHFGPLPPAVTVHLAQAAPEQLKLWGEHIFLDVARPDDVLAGN